MFKRFKNRHDIKQFTICFEVRSAETKAAQAFLGELKKIIKKEDCLPSQVYNCDETELHYRLLPEKSLAHSNDNKNTWLQAIQK